MCSDRLHKMTLPIFVLCYHVAIGDLVMKTSFQSIIIIFSLNLFCPHQTMSDVIYNSEWTNPDQSQSESILALYEDAGLKGLVGYYSGSQRNRIIGQYNSNKTVFDGYWVQDDSGQQCQYKVDGSQFYGRLFFKLNTQKEFDGFWGYCDEDPYLPWKGSLKRKVNEGDNGPKLVASKRQEIQIALSFFGYDAGVADGIFGQKTNNAIAHIQHCWEDVDPYAVFVQGTRDFGVLSEAQQTFLLRSYKEAIENGLGSADCSWFEQLARKNVEIDTASLANEMNDSFCDYEGELQDPVFYCSFENGKRLKVCETYNENGMWNSFSYSYGLIGANPELELNGQMTSVYFPEVVGSTSIDYLMPSCTDADGYLCETNHNMRYDFGNTKGQLLFTNDEYEYVVNTSSELGARDRIFDGNLVVNKINKNLPEYAPGFRKKLLSLDCDLGSAFNTIWDGSYVDTIVINEGLCYVDNGDEGIGWETCLP